MKKLLLSTMVLITMIGCSTQTLTQGEIEEEYGQIQNITSSIVTITTQTHHIDAIVTEDGSYQIIGKRKR